MRRLGIIGIGLMGGSLGLALRAARPGMEVVGITRTPEEAEAARRRGAVNEASTELALVTTCDLVVVATPITEIPQMLHRLAGVLPAATLLTDVASVKAPVLDWAQQAFRDRARFLGGHPMAGRTGSGLAAADPALFRGAAWVLTPYPEQRLDRFQPWVALLGEIGARPAFMPAPDHDRSAALTSHLAFTVSAAYTATVGAAPIGAEALAIAGPGYRDMSRLAHGDPALYHAIATANREHLLDAVDRFSGQLASLRQRIADGTAWGADD